MSDRQYKIVLLGEGRVGKTSIVCRYVRNEFNDGEPSTIQATFLQKFLQSNNAKITLNIWDTAGQERFHALGPIYYREADGAVLVYDITDADSFEKVKTWVKELRKVVGPDIQLAIAGNKSDLIKQRQVDESTAEDYAKSVGATHFYTSAKVNKGITEMFSDLAKRIVAKKAVQSSSTSSSKSSTLGKVGGRAKGVQIADLSSSSESRASGSKKGGCC